MAKVNEQRELANEIAEAISNPMNSGLDLDEVSTRFQISRFYINMLFKKEDLKNELADLEQDELNERLAGADHVPIHHPGGASRVEECELILSQRMIPWLIVLRHSTTASDRRRRGGAAQRTASGVGHVASPRIAIPWFVQYVYFTRFQMLHYTCHISVLLILVHIYISAAVFFHINCLNTLNSSTHYTLLFY